MDPMSKYLTAFATPDGATYQYRVMPFGLKNAPATFQKLMACVLSGLLGKCAHVYLDDIIVWSATYEEHIGHLRQVFERLQEFGLRCALKKCRFGVSELPYLGHIVGRDGNRPQERHLVQIRDAVPPRTKKQLQRFLGLANWVREYVPMFATIAAPLTDLLVLKKTLRWTDAAQKAFDKLKTAIDQPLLLHRPDASREYVLQTDASGLGVAAVLYQERNGLRNIISFSSARLNDAQRRYHINEQECLAVVFAIKKYRPYLEDKPFLLGTDNKCLLWLNGAKDSNAKLTRWSLLLQEFNFRIEHCPGKNNELPDVLSRQPEDVEIPDDTEDVDRMLVPKRKDEATAATERVCAIDVPTLMDEVKGIQLADPEFPKVLERWRRIREEGPQEPGERKFAEIYDVLDGHLVKRDGQKILLWVPEAARERVLHEFHDVPEAGHPGYEETLRSILGQYTWPTASRDVRTYVKNCLICATTKRGPIQPGAPLRAYDPERPWQTIAVDFMGPYAITREGNKYILVVTDLFTRWVEAFPVKGATTKTTVKLLENEVFCRWGYPQAVITDNGTQFRSNRFKRACHRWRIRHWLTANYHPRANPTERRNHAGHEKRRRGVQLSAEGRRPDQDEANTADEGKDDAPPINVGSLDPTTPPPQDVLRGHRRRRRRQQIARQRVYTGRLRQGLLPLPPPLLLTAEISPSEEDEESTGQIGD
jgi:transposase InsO family protein